MTESAEHFDPGRPFTVAGDPVEQWLQWEEQANLLGFRSATHPVDLAVVAVPRDRVEVEYLPSAPAAIVERFVPRDGGQVLLPRHPLNRDPGVAYFDAPVVDRWTCRYTSSRTLVVPAGPGEPLFSLKLATDHPHPAIHQPEKTRLREEASWSLDWVPCVERIDRQLGGDPLLQLVRDVLVIQVRDAETACVVRDLRLFQDGHLYLPGLSVPWVGREIARHHGIGFGEFWGRHWAEAVGRAKARLLARYGLWYETPNPQNLLVQLDRALRPTGAVVFRDLGDTECATDALLCESVPWTRLHADIRPETQNSFWAFGEAGDRAVSEETLLDWYGRHDAAYFSELAASFPDAAPGDCPPAALLVHWNEVLRRPQGWEAIASGFARRMVETAATPERPR